MVQPETDATSSLRLGDYIRLYGHFARYCLVREISFRVNFLVRVVTELIWVALLIVFFQVIFLQTEQIGSWTKYEYLIFMATGFIINAFVDALFIDNCSNFSEHIRTGTLDFALLKPIDEQFLLTCQRVDWACIPNLLLGIAMIVYGCNQLGIPVTIERALGFSAMIVAAVAIMYSLLLLMAATSIWMVSNKGLYEFWFYVAQFARYPADIYANGVAGNSLRLMLTYILPIMLAVNVPARYAAQLVNSHMAIFYLFAAAIVMLTLSRLFFRNALRYYRSASS